jgi:uncharacterized membrane protein YfcA
MRSIWAFLSGGLIGILGGLIGLGGAEFRLPLLAGWFRFRLLDSIVINLIVSLITVVFSFIFRTGLVHLDRIIFHTPVMLNILAGSLIGSYFGAGFAANVSQKMLKLMVVILLVSLSLVLMGHDFIYDNESVRIAPFARFMIGFVAGLLIGAVSSTLGVAGGELIIPTIILLFGIDIKLAGSLSLAISIPTILVGLAKYQETRRLSVMRTELSFLGFTSLGSIAGALAGSYLLRYTSGSALQIFLGTILLVSAIHLALKKEPGEKPRPE